MLCFLKLLNLDVFSVKVQKQACSLDIELVIVSTTFIARIALGPADLVLTRAGHAPTTPSTSSTAVTGNGTPSLTRLHTSTLRRTWLLLTILTPEIAPSSEETFQSLILVPEHPHAWAAWNPHVHLVTRAPCAQSAALGSSEVYWLAKSAHLSGGLVLKQQSYSLL